MSRLSRRLRQRKRVAALVEKRVLAEKERQNEINLIVLAQHEDRIADREKTIARPAPKFRTRIKRR